MTAIIPPGQGHRLTARGSVMAFKAVAAQTGGDFSLMERTLPAGGRTPPAHRHTSCSEAFFVLDGVITFWVDGDQVAGGPGDFLLVPRGVAHTFGNSSPGPAGCSCCMPRRWMPISRSCTSSGRVASRRTGTPNGR